MVEQAKKDDIIKEEKTSNAEGSETEAVKIPAKFKDLVEKIEKLNVLELSELVKTLEKKFGVSAAAPIMAVGAVSAGASSGDGGVVEEKSSFNVELKDGGSQKIQVIKLVRELTGKGLKEAKDLVDAVPKIIKEGVTKEEANEIKKKLEEVGAAVELK